MSGSMVWLELWQNHYGTSHKKNTEVQVLPVVDLFKESEKKTFFFLWEVQHRCAVNGMGINAPIVKCGMGETVCERRDGMGTSGQTVGRETAGTGVRYRTAGWYTAGTETNDGTSRSSRSGTKYHMVSRTVSVPTTFSCPIPTFTARTLAILWAHRFEYLVSNIEHIFRSISTTINY